MISQRLRSPGILDATPYLHAGYRCCAACTSGHPYTSFLNWQRGQARAKDNNLYPVWGDDTIWKMLGQLCSRRRRTTNYQWAQLGSNQRPSSYEPPALTTELWALARRIVPYPFTPGKRQFFTLSVRKSNPPQ